MQTKCGQQKSGKHGSQFSSGFPIRSGAGNKTGAGEDLQIEFLQQDLPALAHGLNVPGSLHCQAHPRAFDEPRAAERGSGRPVRLVVRRLEDERQPGAAADVAERQRRFDGAEWLQPEPEDITAKEDCDAIVRLVDLITADKQIAAIISARPARAGARG